MFRRTSGKPFNGCYKLPTLWQNKRNFNINININKKNKISSKLSGKKTIFIRNITSKSTNDIFDPLDKYLPRHIGSSDKDVEYMLKTVGNETLDEFVKTVLPKNVLFNSELKIKPFDGFSESELLNRLKKISSLNKIYRSYIGNGYSGTIVPPVIQRNILECPEWYTSYTPYQPEISQGRLESLINFQTMICDLTGLPISNASLLDEGTAAAEAAILSFNALKGKRKNFYLHPNLNNQTIQVVKSRAEPLGINIIVGIPQEDAKNDICGAIVPYPSSDGTIENWSKLSENVHKWGGLFAVCADLLALTILKPPSEYGADIVFGSSQRFGVPFGYGGPHAAYFAVSDAHKRKIPGRLIGKSKDRLEHDAYRLALQTREQHIRREKATSNICTAQALLANMAAMYAVYHGPQGLKNIASRVYSLTTLLAKAISKSEYNKVVNKSWFDTLTILTVEGSDAVIKYALEKHKINLRRVDDNHVSVSLDETVTKNDLNDILDIFLHGSSLNIESLNLFLNELANENKISLESPCTVPEIYARKDNILKHDVFNSYHSETEMLRYIHHLQSKDLSLANSMIPLGSCTMKLNATTEMIPITWEKFANLHPFAPIDQANGYKEIFKELETDLAIITGFDAVSLQPNSGAQGEYAGLRIIRAYFKSKGESQRNICLIPVSAHGTNPASAVMSGMKVVPVKCLPNGELDLKDLEAKALKHKDNLAAFMITYPSTFGVFEPGVRKAIDVVHSNGGQVYMDGANMNAQIGLTSPGELGADVCHLNLHKTFCIPHGGGGPGMGPIGVKSHLKPFLPGHPLLEEYHIQSPQAIKPISSAPWGSASILTISWAYIKMMGGSGLRKATQLALLNANYMATRLKNHYDILFSNENGRCAHEFIIDIRPFKATAGIEAIDVAKRLQDYGFHGPTMSWPVANTLMIEPTESESKAELDRFVNALISIREEIKEIEDGKKPKENNVLKNSPHPIYDLLSDKWDRPYTREQAAFPLPYLKDRKFWPTTARLNDAYGDLNLFCTCEPPALESLED